MRMPPHTTMSGMSESKRPDVLILGGGVIGLTCAHYLLQAGRSVHVLDQGLVGAATSHGNCGTITPSHAPPLAAPGAIIKGLKWVFSPDAPFYIRPRLDLPLASWLLHFAARCNKSDWRQAGLAKAELLGTSRRLLAQLIEEQQLSCEFETSGLRYVYRDAGEFEQACAELPELAEFDIQAQILDAQALAKDEPALLPGMAGAIHFPNDACLRPDSFVRQLADRVREQGGIIEENATVSGFTQAKGGIESVATSRGPRQGSNVLLALGPWSPLLTRQLGLRLPIQPGKGYSITYSRPTIAPKTPLVLKQRSVCVTAWESGFRLGSTMEFAGYDTSLNRTRLDALERAAREYLHDPFGSEKREEWYGWRPMTYDDLPILGRVPRFKNLWLATGHGMLGVSMSAVTGHLLADLICGRKPVVNPKPSSPDRFV